MGSEDRPGGDGDASDAAPDDAPVAVELDGVSRRYGDATAVSDVDLRIREGEFFTLVGPSGCGKTTTLRLIAGFEAPDAGTVRLGGRSVEGVPPEERNVGVVFQNYALFPHMTVGENVAYGLNFAEPPGGVTREERVRDLLELVDLPGMADREPDELSGGQRQRVAMARALAPGPEVLLLDEPMSALDAQLRERLRAQVKAIQRELGITTVYVTHDQEEALAVSDRVAVMREGTPEQVAPPRTVYRRPATRFVAEFVGDNNVFEGRVEAVENVADAAAGTGTEPTDQLDAISHEKATHGSGSPVEMEGSGGGGADAAAERDGTVAAVDVGEAVVRVRTPGAVAVGDHLAFCVRPENLQILRVSGTEGNEAKGDAESDDPPANVLRGSVASAEFLGETTRVRLAWGNRTLVVRTTDPLSGTVRVGFDPADAHVFARERR
ncbi:hypothetical protein GCM10027435_24130 [Haloparvum alkalitolerans]|uniref:ABC transporter ATP-binding protein n=1 Tax=Haloparvum alkalitolerans TaxID=1042953 RepID=UPI003CEC4EB1